MIILLALLLGSPLPPPPEPKRCVTSCAPAVYGPGYQCWFDTLPSCGRRPECVDAVDLECTPLRVSLGEWN